MRSFNFFKKNKGQGKEQSVQNSEQIAELSDDRTVTLFGIASKPLELSSIKVNQPDGNAPPLELESFAEQPGKEQQANIDEDFKQYLDHNARLFDAFYRDFHSDSLPAFPDPTPDEIGEYRNRRKPQRKPGNTEYITDPFENTQFRRANERIPVEVEIWVDKVMDYYFKDSIHLFGDAGWDTEPRKALYASKGYAWYSVKEIFPGFSID